MASHTDLFEDPIEDITPTYRDLRSRKHALNREAKKSAKYFRYRAVDPKWIGEQYYALNEDAEGVREAQPYFLWMQFDPLLSMPENLHVATWTKRDMWDERGNGIIQWHPHKGHRIREKRHWKYNEKCLQRDTRTRTRNLEFALEHADVENVDTSYLEGHDDLDAEIEGHDDEAESSFWGDGVEWPMTLRDWRACLRETGYDIPDSDSEGNAAMSWVGEPDFESADEVLEYYGFSIASERDFDVMSSSSYGDGPDFELIWNEDGELQM